MVIHINSLVIETYARLDGALAFVETMNDAIPLVEEKEHRYLEHLSAEGRWEFGEYSAEQDVLNQTFRTWVPMFAAYSATILLHSIFENQLDAFAEHIRSARGSKIRVNDMAGKGTERSALYLDRVLSIKVKTDPAWGCLNDLRKLRNIIVHRGGKLGETPEHRKTVDHLLRTYPMKLRLEKADGFHEQIWISMNLCRDLAEKLDEFFGRLFKASGLPNRHGQLVSTRQPSGLRDGGP
jgi:hypothetical protein